MEPVFHLLRNKSSSDLFNCTRWVEREVENKSNFATLRTFRQSNKGMRMRTDIPFPCGWVSVSFLDSLSRLKNCQRAGKLFRQDLHPRQRLRLISRRRRRTSNELLAGESVVTIDFCLFFIFSILLSFGIALQNLLLGVILHEPNRVMCFTPLLLGMNLTWIKPSGQGWQGRKVLIINAPKFCTWDRRRILSFKVRGTENKESELACSA